MSLRKEQCNKVCRILDDVLANRPTERDSLIVATISAFSALSEPHWIPVTEKLPKDGQYILAYYPEFECGCLVQKYRTIGNYGFVAWMPLPEPFKGVTE